METSSGNAFRRAARARLARCAAVLLLGLAAAGLAAAWIFSERVLDWLDARTKCARDLLVSALRENHGLDFYAPLDERIPVETITGLPLLGAGAVRVPGAFGSARRFDGEAGENLVSAKQRWSPFVKGGFTLAFWARIPPEAPSGEARLVWDRGDRTGFGLRLVGGRVEASFGDATGLHVLSAPAPAPGRFSHIAVSIGLDRASLHVDGEPCDACEVVPPLTFRGHPLAFGTDVHFPPSLDLDEWGVWRHPLDGAEVARLASARHPLPSILEPRLAAGLRRREAQASFFRSVLDTLGALRPSMSAPAVLNSSFPALELRFSGDDRRHFRAAHLESLASGFRTRRGARQRHVQASFGDRSERVAAWLDETVPALFLSSRPAFVLASTNGLFGNASGLVRLFPPEQFGERRPDAARPLPLDPSILVRLHLNGDFLGLYCLVPFETPAPPWFATGARDVKRLDRLHFATPTPGSAAGAGLSEEERDAAWRKMFALLGTDPGFPLLPSEVNLLARRHELEKEAFLLPDPESGPAPFLGTNPSALYVTNDLDLAAAGPGVVWSSSDPALVSPEGRVTRPGEGPPRFVELSAALPDGTARSFRFRVMPRAPALPALFLHIGRPLDKLYRTDFACCRIPAGEGGDAVWLHGAGGGAGAKLRGNTSYLTGRRRSISLKFNEPVFFPGAAAPVRHLLLLSGYADPTRLRNALSFDVFRSMSPGDAVRAAPVSWTEVFVNGAYAGVWEISPRLQDVLSESFSALYKVRAPDGLWTSARESAEVVDRVAPAGEDVVDADPYASFRELARFVAESPSADFAAAAAKIFDLDELVDFFLLVNFTGNEDGRVTNQYAGRRAGDGRWVLLPWDYDKTFLLAPAGDAARSGLLVSPLFARLFAEVPGFRERVARRWLELRAGPLSATAVDAWIQERSGLLAPFMDEDYRIVPPLGHDGDFAAAVESLRAEVKFRFAHVDRLCGDLP